MPYMGLQMDTANPFDLAVLFRLEQEGAQGREVISKGNPGPDPNDPRSWYYAVRAESWATEWRYEDGDLNADENIRLFEAQADSRGAVHVSRYAEALF
jgi:hypothetical protein